MINRTKPTPKKIFEYWRNICLEEPKKVLYCLFDDTRYENIIEGNEKTCFCCGIEGYIERAHIVPLSLGGTNSLDNLLLLCPKCHTESPDVIDARYMFEWLNQQPYYASRYLAIKMGMVYLDDLIKLIKLFSQFNNMDQLMILMRLGLSLGMASGCIINDFIETYNIKLRQASTHGFTFSESTKVAVINQALLFVINKYEKMTNKNMND